MVVVSLLMNIMTIDFVFSFTKQHGINSLVFTSSTYWYKLPIGDSPLHWWFSFWGFFWQQSSSPRKKPKSLSYVQTVTYALLHDEHIFIFRQVSQWVLIEFSFSTQDTKLFHMIWRYLHKVGFRRGCILFFTDSCIISKIRFFMYLNVKFSLFVLIFQMSLPRPSGLKAPTKIGRPTGLPQPRSAGTGIPTPGSVHKAQSKPPPHFVVVLFFTMSPAGEVICDLSVIVDYHCY